MNKLIIGFMFLIILLISGCKSYGEYQTHPCNIADSYSYFNESYCNFLRTCEINDLGNLVVIDSLLVQYNCSIEEKQNSEKQNE